jgi:transposase-like protein
MGSPANRRDQDRRVQCPRCKSDAIYKYGKVRGEKQRYICLVCKRQFIENPSRRQVKNRPACPECGKWMHVYIREEQSIRFRCSDYPRCRTFKKEMMEEE